MQTASVNGVLTLAVLTVAVGAFATAAVVVVVVVRSDLLLANIIS